MAALESEPPAARLREIPQHPAFGQERLTTLDTFRQAVWGASVYSFGIIGEPKKQQERKAA